jgi:hypothetical protein
MAAWCHATQCIHDVVDAWEKSVLTSGVHAAYSIAPPRELQLFFDNAEPAHV